MNEKENVTSGADSIDYTEQQVDGQQSQTKIPSKMGEAIGSVAVVSTDADSKARAWAAAAQMPSGWDWWKV